MGVFLEAEDMVAFFLKFCWRNSSTRLAWQNSITIFATKLSNKWKTMAYPVQGSKIKKILEHFLLRHHHGYCFRRQRHVWLLPPLFALFWISANFNFGINALVTTVLTGKIWEKCLVLFHLPRRKRLCRQYFSKDQFSIEKAWKFSLNSFFTKKCN